MINSILSKLASSSGANRLTILIYHQVLETADALRPSEPDARQFDWQMQLLRKHFNPLSLQEAVQRLSEQTLPARSVCVTFDDGYLNNLTVANPILQRYQIPATVFVATAFSDGDNMWNDRVLDLFQHRSGHGIDLSCINLERPDLHSPQALIEWANRALQALKYLPYAERLERIEQLIRDNQTPLKGAQTVSYREPRKMMLPDEIRQLAQSGIEIGAHTHNHPILLTLTPDEIHWEIHHNRKLLESWCDSDIAGFAYPNGKPGKDYDADISQQVQSLGFHYAVSTRWGINRPSTDRFNLNRFTPWDRTPTRFHTRLVWNLMNRQAS